MALLPARAAAGLSVPESLLGARAARRFRPFARTIRVEDARIVAWLAALIAAALVIIAAAVYFGSLRQDRVERDSEERIVGLSLRNLEREIAANAKDYAWWDDTVRFLVLDTNWAWADANIGPHVDATFGYEVALVADAGGKAKMGWIGGERATAEAAAALGPLLPRLLAAAAREQELTPQPVSAVLTGPLGLFVAAASPIVPQPGSDLDLPSGPPTFLVFARRLGGEFLAGLRDGWGLESPVLADPKAPVGARASVNLEGPDGEVVARILWTPRYPGRTQLAWLIPALLGSLAVFAVFTRLVLRSIRRSTAAIRHSEGRFRDIAEAASDWIWETDGELRLTYLCSHFGRATGLRPGDALGKPLHDLLALPDRERREKQQACIAARDPFRNLLCVFAPPGQEARSLRVAGKPVYASDGTFLGYRGTATDITAETEALRQVQFLAEHDSLTALPNRLVLHDRLAEAAARCARHGEGAALLCIDLDRFKAVNDRLGHAAGDELLVACAQRLTACVRETDLVARLGGDEFAVLQVGVSKPRDIQALCDRIQAAVSAPFRLSGGEAVVGASIGVAVLPGDSTDPGKLLQHADTALYRAKAEGRNRARFFEPGMDERLRQRRGLERALRRAITADEIEVHYQPEVGIESLEVEGLEALVRWRHPVRGVVAPAEFVPVAEETGLMVPIGERVLQTACRDARRWPGVGVGVAVNLSPAQLRQRDLVPSVERALAGAGLESGRLTVEITEAVLIHDTAEALRTLERLKRLGTAVALDDFGVGCSSLSYLRQFPFDKIKIDRSLVAGLRPENAALVRAIVGLGRSLGMRTCAEGVETLEQLELLRQLGCEQVQGFLFAGPGDAAAAGRLVAARRFAEPGWRRAVGQ